MLAAQRRTKILFCFLEIKANKHIYCYKKKNNLSLMKMSSQNEEGDMLEGNQN